MSGETTHPLIAARRQAVIDGDARTAAATTERALADGLAPHRLVDEALIPAMDEAGRRFDVIDLGADVPPGKFVAAVTDQRVDTYARRLLSEATVGMVRLVTDSPAGLVQIVAGAPPDG